MGPTLNSMKILVSNLQRELFSMVNQVLEKLYWQKLLQIRPQLLSLELSDLSLLKSISVKDQSLSEKFSKLQKIMLLQLFLLMKLMQLEVRDMTHHPEVRKKFKEQCLSFLISLMDSIQELMSRLSWPQIRLNLLIQL